MTLVLKSCLALALIGVQFFIYFPAPAAEAQTVPNLIFPVIDTPGMYYRDDFGDPRGGGTRSHEGNDILAPKMTALVAVTDGEVRRVNYPEASWGYAVILRGDNGYDYWYLHINNDNPGTDDGMGGAMNAYAPYMDRGIDVVAGQLIGWMGDSGNAETTSSHLHFEVHPRGGGVINPYPSLQAARKIKTPVEPPAINGEMLPFDGFAGGAHIAYGNFDNSNQHEIVAGAGPGGTPHVRLFERNGDKIGTFHAYDENFRGGVDVAAGDLDGDGIDEIITGPGAGGGPHVKMFNKDGTSYVVEGFFAFTPSFSGGVNVAAADIDNDGKDEIIVGAGSGGGPHVRVFESDGTPLGDGFFAYDAGFRSGVDVTATDGTGSQQGSVITGAGPGGGPHVKVFSPEGELREDFYAYDEGFMGGVRVSAGAIGASGSCSSGDNNFDDFNSYDNDEDRDRNWWRDRYYDQYGRTTSSTTTSYQIITAPVQDGGADIRIYNTDGSLAECEQMFEEWWQGGYDVAAGNGITFVSTTDGSLSFAEGRRASIQEGPN